MRWVSQRATGACHPHKKGMIGGQTEYQLIHRGDVSDSVSSSPTLSPTGDHRRAPGHIPIGRLDGGLAVTEGGERSRSGYPCVRLAKLRTMADGNAEIHLIRGTLRAWRRRQRTIQPRLLNLDTLDHIVSFDMSRASARRGSGRQCEQGQALEEDYRTLVRSMHRTT